jgi:hypothetical protein
MFAFFFIFLVATSAWPKFKEDEQKFLNDQFKSIQDQVRALTTQVQTLNAQVQELRQSQALLRLVVDNQQRSLKELNEIVRSMQLGSEENFSSLKTAITQARNETLANLKPLIGGTGSGPASTESTKPGSTPVLQCNVIGVEGNNVTLDVGSSSAGIRPGARLKLYKASDPNTQVGVIEIMQVIDAGNSRAQIVTLNPGVRLEWGDVARLE